MIQLIFDVHKTKKSLLFFFKKNIYDYIIRRIANKTKKLFNMVVLKNFISSDFTSLESIEGRVLYDRTQKILRFHDSVSYNNLLISKDINNNVVDINNVTVDGNIIISSHNGIDTGLILNNTLVTASANQLNYTNVLEGVASPSKALILDSDRDIENINTISATTVIADNLNVDVALINALNTTGNVGINTTARLYGLEVNHSSGDCLRLTYNDNDGSPSFRCDFQVTPTGSLTISPTGNNPSVLIGGNISGHSLSLTKQNASNDTVDLLMSLTVLPDNTPQNGLGAGIEFASLNSTYTIFTLGTMEAITSNILDSNETGEYKWRLAKNGVLTEVASLSANSVFNCTELRSQSLYTELINATHIVETSDKRLKTDISDIQINESKNSILQLQPKKYKFIKEKNINKIKEYSGFIAQEVKEILPSVIEINNLHGYEDLHQIQYTGIIPHLVNCIKDLYSKLENN